MRSYTAVRNLKVFYDNLSKVILSLLIISSLLLSACNSKDNSIHNSTETISETSAEVNINDSDLDLPLFDEEIDEITDINFIATSDIHYISQELGLDTDSFQVYMDSSDSRMFLEIDEILEAFVDDILALKPDFIMVNGDLTNHGEKLSHMELAQYFKEIEAGGTEVYVTPGNHDILNPYARAFTDEGQILTEYVTIEEFKDIYSDFGFSQSDFEDKDSLSYVEKINSNLWLLMVDTSVYKDNIEKGYPQVDGYISPSTQLWIDDIGEKAKLEGAQLITGMHHNLIEYCEVSNPMFLNSYMVKDTATISSLFYDNGIEYVFSGHSHAQNITKEENESKDKYIYEFITSPLIFYPHQYRYMTFSVNDKVNNYAELNVNTKLVQDIVLDHVDNYDEYAQNLLSNHKDGDDYLSALMFAYGRGYDTAFVLENSSDYDYESSGSFGVYIKAMEQDIPPVDNDILIDNLTGDYMPY